MYHKKGSPKHGELVICIPKRIMSHSAILELVEYENAEAFLHISQVSDGWVKSIADHIQKDAELVCRVMGTGEKIEVSAKQVSKEAYNSKMNEWRSEKKSVNILKAAAKKIGKTDRDIEREIANPVMKEYGSIHAFIELLKQEGDGILDELKIPKQWKNPILEYAVETVKKVQVKKEIELYTLQPGGVETIKKTLKKVGESGVSVKYISTPKYLLQVTSPNYKDAQKKIDDALNALEQECSRNGIKLKYDRK